MLTSPRGFLTSTLAAGLLALLGMSPGCGGSPASQSPTGPTPPTPTAGSPSITAIDPRTGSTGGGTAVKITGTGFQSGATVTVGDDSRAASVENSTTIHVTTPVHAAGTVDVVVTNPGGQAARLTGAYTYASPQSFDFNGTWAGLALAHPELQTAFAPHHADMEMRFTIQGNRLASITCGFPAETLTFSTPLSVSNGEFSFAGDGVAISGRIVSAAGAVGTINTPPCPATRWTATRQ